MPLRIRICLCCISMLRPCLQGSTELLFAEAECSFDPWLIVGSYYWICLRIVDIISDPTGKFGPVKPCYIIVTTSTTADYSGGLNLGLLAGLWLPITSSSHMRKTMRVCNVRARSISKKPSLHSGSFMKERSRDFWTISSCKPGSPGSGPEHVCR